MPKKGTPMKPEATPTRIMTRPSRLRTPRASANPATSSNPLPTVEEASDTITSSPTPATAKPKPQTPAKPKTPAKSKTPATSKATTKKGAQKSKSSTAAPPQVVEVSDDDKAEEVEGGSPGKGIVVSNTDSSPLSSPISVTPPPDASVKTPKPVKGKPAAFEDKPYKDADVSGDEPAPSPTAKAVAGRKRKTVQFADRTYTPGEESSDDGKIPRPKGSSRKRKFPRDEDKGSEGYDEEQEGEDLDVDEDYDYDYLYFLHDLNRSTEDAALEEELVQEAAPEMSISRDSELQASSSLAIGPASPTVPGPDTVPSDEFPFEPLLQSASSSGYQGSNRHTPKRQRTHSSPTASASNKDTAHFGTGADNLDDLNDPIAAARALFLTVQKAPRPLDLGEISALFMVLQEKISAFCKTHFNFDLTSEQEEEWPMHLLDTKYKALFEVTQWIADGSSCGWRSFFTKKENRRHLVHGIVSEYFQQHIFKHTAFGIREDMIDDLEDIDREYLRYDAFVRNKKKAAYMENSRFDDEYFPTPGDHPPHPEYPPNHQYHHDIDLAARRLATTMMQVLEPLLPPPCFDPLVRQWRRSASQRNQGALLRNDIWFDLVDLVRKAVSLHHCIRFAGSTGLVVRIAPHVAKGTMFTVDDADRNICVNAEELNSSASRPQGPDARLRVKMTCFGRVEAVMPRGLDLEQMEKEQNAAQAAGYILTREEAERKLFPKLPYELQETDAGRNAVAHLDPVPGTEWNTALYRANLENHVDQRFSRETTPTLSTEVISHPFVTIYPRVAPSNLYCEWVADESSQDQGGQTLWEAVQEARKEKLMFRLRENAWKTISDPLLLQWAMYCGIACSVGIYGTRQLSRMLETPRSQEVLTDVQTGANNALSALSAMGVGATSYLSGLLTSSTRTSTTLRATRIYPWEWTRFPPLTTIRDTITSTVSGTPITRTTTVEMSILDTVFETYDPLTSVVTEDTSGMTTPIDIDESTATTTPMDIDMDADTDEATPDVAEYSTTQTPHSTASDVLLESLRASGILTASGTAHSATRKEYVFRSTVDKDSEEFARIQMIVRERMRAEGKLVENDQPAPAPAAPAGSEPQPKPESTSTASGERVRSKVL
ncbi:hypothetical protein G647_01865 [Cladophialophora carrionii CBS 160.54]|uniref:Uncharacterized protein n=1 Tax=Cladophialophora carrionii CBS 160.54 TaxID=1279043 RepID=V9DTV9_9EURO|nr:uncharacterized protein G647_01865 [Cladophialophora carrionii CBS 160.54]ETI29412.1 hypothetical protein G647_01865 [Cladophialophora carrionii CBS 160.54]